MSELLSNEPALFVQLKKELQIPAEKSLDIGCGLFPRNPLDCASVVGVDIRESPNVIFCDLARGILPFDDSSFSCVSAFDFLEHVPRINPSESGEKRFPFVLLMREIYRVLIPGGILYHRTPAFPHPAVFRDPTHVNIITDETMPLYFCGVNPWANMYGFSSRGFELLHQEFVGCHLIGAMRK